MNTDLAGEVDDAVARALAELSSNANWRTYSGQQQRALSEQLQTILGCEQVGLTSSGSAALEIMLRACRLPPGSEVLLAGYDYPGTFAGVERVGLRPALVDVEGHGWNLSLESLESVVRPACRVMIVSHLHGQLQPIAALHRWCCDRNIWLIQDACQALGASIEGQPPGRFGDATIVSFGGSKVISAGRGGAWTTSNAELAQHARIAAGVGSGAYELSELQAAAVLAQLPFLERITQQCREYFKRQAQSVAQLCAQIRTPWLGDVDHTAFYQAGWLLPTETASSLSELSQSQRAAHERIGIGSGFPGYHRRSARRCRIDSTLTGTTLVSQTTLTVHFRAALNDTPVARLIAELVNGAN